MHRDHSDAARVMGRVENRSPYERVYVTELAGDDGHFYDAPMPDDDDPLADSGKRQLLCSPATWEQMKAEAPLRPGVLAPSPTLWGIPVVIEGA